MKISRRLLFASPFFIRSLDAYASDVDVCIIGAGSAGIAAAKTLIAQGKSVKILEASGRLGGRLYTDNSLGGIFDAGGAYIHFADQNPFMDIVKAQNAQLDLITFGGNSRFSLFENGKPLDDEAQKKRRDLAFKIRNAIDDYEGRDKSLAAVAYDEDDDGVSAARQTSLFALGEEPDRVSVRDYNSLISGMNYALPQGYGTLLNDHAKGLAIELNTVVSRIDTSGILAKITTNKGVITAKAVIITVSIGVLQAGGIEFHPKLSRAHEKALSGFKMGALTKIAVATTADLSEFAGHKYIQDWYGNKRITIELLPHNNKLIIALISGDEARSLIKEGEIASVDYLKSRLSALFGENIKTKLGNGVLHGWWGNRFHYGSYANVIPKHFASRELIREPITPRVYFAGEATALEKSMTAGGAYLEGVRIANLLYRLL